MEQKLSDTLVKAIDRSNPMMQNLQLASRFNKLVEEGGGDVDLEDNHEVSITENGTVEITPAEGKDGMKKVTVNVSVAGSSIKGNSYIPAFLHYSEILETLDSYLILLDSDFNFITDLEALGSDISSLKYVFYMFFANPRFYYKGDSTPILDGNTGTQADNFRIEDGDLQYQSGSDWNTIASTGGFALSTDVIKVIDLPMFLQYS